MTKFRIILISSFLCFGLNAQSGKFNFAVTDYNIFTQSPELILGAYHISYDYDWRRNWPWDYSNYIGFLGEYHFKRFSFEMGLYGFIDKLSFTGKKVDSYFRYDLTYSENRLFLGFNAGGGFNFFKPENKSSLLLKVLFFFDKRVHGKVIEDNIKQTTRATGGYSEYSAVEKYGIYDGVRMRPFLQLEYNYQFAPKWYAGIMAGYHSGDIPRTEYLFKSASLIGYIWNLNAYTIGLKLGYTFPMKEK